MEKRHDGKDRALMGMHPKITHNTFPKQGDNLGDKVKLCFHYDLDNLVDAICVRDDAEEPWFTMFRTTDGSDRVVLATECAWSPR